MRVSLVALASALAPLTAFVILPHVPRSSVVTEPSRYARSTPYKTPTEIVFRGREVRPFRAVSAHVAAGGANLRMLVEPKGEDSFREIGKEVEGDPLKKTASKMNPGVAKAVITGAIPVATAVGFLATPTSKLALSAVGAAVSGVGGGWARKKLKQARKEAAPAHVAMLLESKGVGNITPDELKESMSSFGLEGQEAEDVLVQIFSKYVVAMCQNSATKTSEIKELSELRETLGLDGLLMGEALYQASSSVYSQFVFPTPEAELADEWSPSRRALDKFIFLCDRMFEVCDTEEAYMFEMGRICKVFDLSLEEVKNRCAAISCPFYEKALGSATVKWETVKAEQLKRARRTLGISDDTAGQMHREAFREEALKLVRKEGEDGVLKLTGEDKNRLNKLAVAFELSEEDATKEYEAVVVPIYQDVLVECLSNLMGDASPSELAKTYGQLMMFTGDTQLRQEAADAALREIVTATVEDMYAKAAQFTRVANVKEAAAAAKGILSFVRATVSMVEMTLSEAEREMDPYDKAIGGSVVSWETRKDAPALYQMFLQSCFSQPQMTESDQESISLLARLLAIGEEEQVRAYREAAGPRVLKQLTESVQEGIDTGIFSEEAKKANDKLIKDFNVPNVVILEQAKVLYEKTVEAYCGDNRIPTNEQKEILDNMADFLSMPEETVQEIHGDICSDTFRKAVAESMGATGVVMPEYRAKLDELAERLGLSKESATRMFHAAVRQRMVPMMQQILYEFERSVLSKDQLAKKTGKDAGADVLGASGGELGIQGKDAVTSDLLALIDFYVDNGLVGRDEDGKNTFPVTAAEMADDQMLAALYQNFVVAGFGVEGEKLKRYERGQDKLAGILGLDDSVKMKIHREIGGTVVRRFVNQELAKAGKMSPQGVAFLANIQSRLSMPQEMFEGMIRDCQQDYLRSQAEELFRLSVTDAKECRKLRELASNCGMSLAEEGNMDVSSRKGMFEIEAEDMIENGDMDGDEGQEFVEDLAEALSLTLDEAQETLVGLLSSRAKSILMDVKADAMEERDDRVLKASELLLKYCRLAGGMEVDNDLDSKQKNVILNVFEARHAGTIAEGAEGETEARQRVADDLDLLKLAVGMES